MYQIKGRIDSTNAADFEKELLASLPTELDAADLDYISSAGLRVLLKLKKAVGEVSVCNVNSNIYEVFDMTGFTDLLNVKKAIREIDVEGKEIIGQGGNGTVYRLDDETIVKLYRPEYALENIEREQRYAKAAFISGIPSVITFDTVRSGDRYGIVFEALNCDTLGHAIQNDTEHMDEYVKKYAEFAKTIHTTQIRGEEIATLKSFLRKRVTSDDMRLFCEQSEIDVLVDIIDHMADCNTLVHGDLHPGNIMIQDGELMLIDMGDATRGPSIFDVASAYRDLLSGPKTSPDTARLSVGMEPETALAVGEKFMRMYSGAQNEEQLKGFLDMVKLVYAFNVVTFIPDIPIAREQYAPSIVKNLLRPVVIPNAETLKHILSK